MTAAGRKRLRTSVRPKAFYAGAFAETERSLLAAAAEVEGLAEEIAALRVRLFKAIKEHPEDLPLLTHGISALTRAVAAQYRLSPKAKRDLADNLAAALNSLGDQLLPPE